VETDSLRADDIASIIEKGTEAEAVPMEEQTVSQAS
jgi:hypothetical protein